MQLMLEDPQTNISLVLFYLDKCRAQYLNVNESKVFLT